VGATHGNILRLVVGQALVLSVIGVAAGLVGAAVFTRLLQALLYQVRTVEPVVSRSRSSWSASARRCCRPGARCASTRSGSCGADADGGRAPGQRCASIIARRLAISLSRDVHVHLRPI
jgi:hypothetical protein